LDGFGLAGEAVGTGEGLTDQPDHAAGGAGAIA
jgi:hypothetical protein